MGKGKLMSVRKENVRDDLIDLVKGIGIVLMVVRHAKAPYSEIVLLFHMALFFIASGYLYKSDKINNILGLQKYIVKKIKGLWLPYFLYSVLFILLNNVFIYLNIYSDNPLFIAEAEKYNLDAAVLGSLMGITGIFNMILKAVYFNGNTQIGGALWFFQTLFLVLVLYAVIDLLIKKLFNTEKTMIFKGGVAIVLLIIGYLFCLKGISAKGMNRVCSVYCLIYIGELFREVSLIPIMYNYRNDKVENTNLFRNLTVIILCLLILIFANTKGYISVVDNYIQNPIFFLVVSIVGWILINGVAIILLKIDMSISRLIKYISIHSVSIIALHFLAFKVVNLIGIIVYDIDIYMLAAFPVLFNKGFWWIIYTFVGVMLPLFIDKIMRCLYRKMLLIKGRNI